MVSIKILKTENEDDSVNDISIYDISTFGADYTLEVLSNKVDKNEILIPEFQRNYVWTSKQASKLIESFLLGLPVPQIFLYIQKKTESLIIVDGLQRIITINSFFKEKFPNGKRFYLLGVDKEWEGQTYSQLGDFEKRRLKNSILRATMFQQNKPSNENSMVEVFKRLNTAGTILSQQEIRNALYHGEIVYFLKKLNDYSTWRKLLNRKEPDVRLKDIEMILRFFALYESWESYSGSMREFISNFMATNRVITEIKKKKLEKVFTATVDKIYNEIGEKAFRTRSSINVAVFDSIMTAVALMNPKKNINISKYKELISGKNERYLNAISKATANPDNVKMRIKIAQQYLNA